MTASAGRRGPDLERGLGSSAPAGSDAVTAELAAMLSRLGELAAGDTATAGDPTSDAARIDRIAALERIKAVAAAAQGAQIVRFARSQVDAHVSARVDPQAVGRGIAEQIALACAVSPSEGARRLGVARVLWAELPAVAELLRSGQISEYVAGLVVTETRHLDPETRRVTDEKIVAAGIGSMSPRRAAATARKLAYEADPQGFVERGRHERRNRRVGVRPAADSMSVLSGFLPVEQGVACWAALRRHTDRVIGEGDGRTRDQIMADTLVERLTGRATATATATAVNVEVGIVMPVEALLDPASTATAEVTGYGSLPARLARRSWPVEAGRGGGGGCSPSAGRSWTATLGDAGSTARSPT
jgi:hypothetical protein